MSHPSTEIETKFPVTGTVCRPERMMARVLLLNTYCHDKASAGSRPPDRLEIDLRK
jgi:hypothetical protein